MSSVASPSVPVPKKEELPVPFFPVAVPALVADPSVFLNSVVFLRERHLWLHADLCLSLLCLSLFSELPSLTQAGCQPYSQLRKSLFSVSSRSLDFHPTEHGELSITRVTHLTKRKICPSKAEFLVVWCDVLMCVRKGPSIIRFFIQRNAEVGSKMEGRVDSLPLTANYDNQRTASTEG